MSPYYKIYCTRKKKRRTSLDPGLIEEFIINSWVLFFHPQMLTFSRIFFRLRVGTIYEPHFYVMKLEDISPEISGIQGE